jgi:GTP-binding protein Era
VFLELFVKVQDEWRSSRGFVEELDWRRQLEQLAATQQKDRPDQLKGVDESRVKPAEDAE